MADIVYRGSGRFTVEEDFRSAGEGDVVEMRFVGFNPLDARILRGVMDRGIEVPFVPGIEGSGYWNGRPVIVSGSGVGTSRDGTMRRRAVVPRSAIHQIPDWLDLRVAAVLGTAGVTAWCLVRTEASIGDGDVVLVLGATGGVGSLAVQLSVAAGAEVWGQTGAAEKAPMIAAAGATPLVAGSPDALASQRDVKPTVVLDGLGGGFTGASLRLLRPGGSIHVFGASAGPETTVDVLRLYRIHAAIRGYASMTETPEKVELALAGVLKSIEDGSLTVPIDRVVPLNRIEDALVALENRHVLGKIVLEVDVGHRMRTR